MSDNPFVKRIDLVQPKSNAVVVLERTQQGVTPDYCVHGQTKCYACAHWCWLGDKTYEIVRSGNARPFCLQCAAIYIPRDTAGPIANLHDHRRADGPH